MSCVEICNSDEDGEDGKVDDHDKRDGDGKSLTAIGEVNEKAKEEVIGNKNGDVCSDCTGQQIRTDEVADDAGNNECEDLHTSECLRGVWVKWFRRRRAAIQAA